MKFDTDNARALLSKLVKDLRANRLWPLAIVLLVAIVAVPIALSKSASRTPVAPRAQVPAPSGSTSLPALNVQSSSSKSRLPGRGRDPFAGQASTTPGPATGTTGSAGASTSGTTGTTVASGAGGTTTSGSGSTAAPTTVPTTPPSIIHKPKPKPAPSGLSSTQSYDVSLEITNSAGGLDSIDPLQRLSVLPSERQALLVELGVLKGGSRVLFAVLPGAVLGGPGVCTPGPVDCEILSLAQGQTEAVGVKTSSGQSWSALFAVSAISAVTYPSAAAADRARRSESAAGRRILESSSAPSLSLFKYDPSVGAVLDLRNLTVGQN
jgi:hypothetical protein